MFVITKSFTFEASHQLKHHDGKCANLHGHSYTLLVELSSAGLHDSGPQTNMVADFGLISKAVKKLISSHLDHHHLNNSLHTNSPTAEFIANWCFDHLSPLLPSLSAVTIKETANATATFRQYPSSEKNHHEPLQEHHQLHQHHSFCPHCTHCQSTTMKSRQVTSKDVDYEHSLLETTNNRSQRTNPSHTATDGAWQREDIEYLYYTKRWNESMMI